VRPTAGDKGTLRRADSCELLSTDRDRSPMDLFVFLAVLTAAAFHAGWNALLKLNV
jgi:hypothetical protein